MAATVQTALSLPGASPIGGARVGGAGAAGAAGAAIVTPGGPLQSGAVVAVVAGGALRVRQVVVIAAAGRLPATGEVEAGAGAATTAIAAGITAMAVEGRAAGRNGERSVSYM